MGEKAAQDRFHDFRIAKVKSQLWGQALNGWKNMFFAMYAEFRPLVGPSFLRECWEYGPYLERMTRSFRGDQTAGVWL